MGLGIGERYHSSEVATRKDIISAHSESTHDAIGVRIPAHGLAGRCVDGSDELPLVTCQCGERSGHDHGR